MLRGLDAGATALNQANNVPRELVGLRQHGLAGLQHDLVAGQGRHLRRHVSIPNDRFARNRVLLQYLESVQVAHDGVFLESTQLPTQRRDLVNRPLNELVGIPCALKEGQVKVGQ